MVRPIYENFVPAVASPTYFAANVTGAAWTITTNTTSDGLAHQVTLQNNSVTDYSASTVTFTGLDQDGKTQVQTINMPAGSATVTTPLYFKSLTSAVPSVAIIGTMNIGTSPTFSSRTITSDWQGNEAFVCTFPRGTISTTVQYTGSNTEETFPPYDWQSDAGTAVVNATTPAAVVFYGIPLAWRLIANSYSADSSVKLTISQMNHNN